MAYLTFQKQGGGRYTTIYATVARWGDLKDGRRGSVQERLYIGRLDESTGKVRVSKGIVGGTGVEVGVEELRQRVDDCGSLQEVRLWLSAPGGSAGAAPSVAATRRSLSGCDLGTALLGQVHVLGEAARAIGLDGCLKDAFGDVDGPALLYLAMHQAVRGEPLYLAEAWMDDLWLPPVLSDFDFSSPGLSRLMAATGRNERARQTFYRAWAPQRQHPRALIYDITSISTYAAALEAATYGYNRDGEPLPQENLALVCDRRQGMPLFCRLIPGSVPDVVTLDATARILRGLGLKDSEFVLDRGFYSNSNTRDLLLNGHHFTMGVLSSCRQARDLIAKHRGTLNSPKRSVYHEGRSIRYMCDQWTVSMGRDSRGSRRPARTVQAHVFFDPRRHADRTADLEERVFALEDKAAAENFSDTAQARRWLAENARYLAPCLGTDKQADGSITVRRRPRAIAARSANAGYQLIICDAVGREATEVLGDYRSRDRAEKLFDLYKNEDGQHRLRTGRQSVAEGRVFLAFLALVLHTELENRLRQAGLLRRISCRQFLAEMGLIRAISLPDGTRLLRELTRRQRQWMAEVHVPLPEL